MQNDHGNILKVFIQKRSKMKREIILLMFLFVYISHIYKPHDDADMVKVFLFFCPFAKACVDKLWPLCVDKVQLSQGCSSL